MTETTKTVPVVVLKRLGSQVPEFDLPVTVSKLNGGQATLSLRCKAMRKTAWAALRDQHHRSMLVAMLPAADAAEPDAVAPVVPEAPASPVDSALTAIAERGHEANVREGLKRDAETVLSFATGWDLEDGFTVEALMGLEDEFGGSLVAILSAYDKAIYQGRLGN